MEQSGENTKQINFTYMTAKHSAGIYSLWPGTTKSSD
jgi:hypothetical protein